MLATLLNDLRYAARVARRQPLLSVVVVLTLTLGIGLNAGVFAIIDGLLFRSRVAHTPSTFVELQLQPPLVSLEDYQAYTRAASLQSLTAWTPVHAEAFVPLLVTCNFFTVYGPVSPLVGRVLRDDDCRAADGSAVAVIGEELWRTRYAADPAAVGQTLSLNNHEFTIVGVLPRDFDGQLRAPIWLPYTAAAPFFDGRAIARERSTPWLLGMTGRLRRGATREAAAAELRVIAQQQDRLVPDRQTKLRVTDGSMIETPQVREASVWFVPIVMGTVALVLMVACLNVAVLMLSRAVARRHEIAVRLSIGASRGQLLQMLLTESVLLAACAVPPSLYLAFAVPRVFKALIPTLPYYPFAVDGAVLAFLFAATFAAGIAAGIAPAIESLKSDVAPSLHRHARWLGIAAWQPRELLIVAQVAMSLVLLVGAAFFVRAERAIEAHPGFEVDRVLAVAPRLSRPPHTAASAAAFYRTLAAEATALPGVRSTAFSNTVAGDELVAASGVVTAESNRVSAMTAMSNVSPEYFATLGLALARGGTFGDRTDRSAAIVSASLARTLWPDHDPVGERLWIGMSSAGAPLTVVGVASDVPSLFGKPAQRTLYRLRPSDAIADTLLVRFDGDERQTADAIRSIVVRLDPNAAAEPRTLAALRRDTADRFMRLVDMVVFLAVVALVLASIGIYGAVAFAVARRMKEIGIRVALGATRTHVTGLVLWTGTKPIGAGVVAGMALALVAALALARAFKNTPAEIDPFDLVAYAAVGVVLATAGLIAMAAPCVRANSTEPAQALHHD